MRTSQKGFTLIEVLVTTAVIGILAVMSSVILINTVRNSNKANITNEAKENLALIAEYLERDVRRAVSASVAGNVLDVINSDGTVTEWTCQPGAVNVNSFVRRDLQNSSGTSLYAASLTNRDSQEGVQWTVCQFRQSGPSDDESIITLDITLTEGARASGGPSDLGVTVTQTITAFTRSF